jgi:DnaJ-class molecular chaperone
MTDQAALLLTPPVQCRRCDGTGSTYYIPISAPIIGGKRIVCPECVGTGWVGGDPPPTSEAP